VEHAKIKLRVDMKFKAALDRHGVPLDRDLRIAIHKAFSDIKQQSRSQ